MSYGPQDGGGHGRQPEYGGGQGPRPQDGYGWRPQDGYGRQPGGGQGSRTNALAVAALVLGVIGLLSCGSTSLLGIVFGHIALSQTGRDGSGGRGLALAGLITSYISVVCWLVFWVAWLGLFSFVAGTGGS